MFLISIEDAERSGDGWIVWLPEELMEEYFIGAVWIGETE